MTTLAPIQTVKLTTEQYFQLGEDPPGVRLELIDGEIIVSPSPSRGHADIVLALAYMLQTHVRAKALGKLYLDTDVRFTEMTARRPEIAFFSAQKLRQMPGDALSLPPDLCIEVLSPSNADDDRINKFDLYQSHGVLHYWIIDPENRTAECFALQGGVYKDVAHGASADVVSFPPFTDLSIQLNDLWAATL